VSDFSYRKSNVSTIVGSNIGSLVFGAIAGLVIATFFVRRRYIRTRHESSVNLVDHVARTTGPDLGTGQYLVEPFLPEDPKPANQTQNPTPPAPTPADPDTQPNSGSRVRRPAPDVYVVDNNAGGVPITVFTGGRGVTELPPSYINPHQDQPTTPPASGGPRNSSPTSRRPLPVPTLPKS
jgi:cytoskeletal protein RodZ